MSKTSLKIKRNIDIHSKRTVFIGNETGEYAKSQINKLPKVDMRRAWQVALGAIPSMGTVKGTETEVIKTYIAQIALGSIPTVVGSSEAFNPSNWKNGDINTLFANSLYGGGISGVHTGATQVEVEPKNIVLGAVSYVGWVKDKNTGKWKYLNQNGEVQTGWKQIDDKWYYFDKNGIMETGWIKDAGKWYYLRSNGEMVSSEWRQDKSGNWYYLRSNGEMAVSQMRKGKDGGSYYLGEDGAMVVNRDITWKGIVYHLDKNGLCSKKRNTTDHNVSDINPKLKVLKKQLIEECDNQGFAIRITEETRTVERQDELYAIGRTTKGNIVTYAKGSSYSSHHQWGTAFDFCRNDGKDPFYDKDGFFSRVGEIGKSIGLEWGGDWEKADKPHFQLPDWGSTTKELKKRYGTPDEFEKTWYQ